MRTVACIGECGRSHSRASAAEAAAALSEQQAACVEEGTVRRGISRTNEIAQTYNEEKPITQEAFYKSMLSSYRKALLYIAQQFLEEEFKYRIVRIKKAAFNQKWLNAAAFDLAINDLLEN